MPDDRRIPGTGPRSEDGLGRARQPRKRRRSMDTYGGISVSEVVARHTGEQPIPDTSADSTPNSHAQRPEPAPKTQVNRPVVPPAAPPAQQPQRRPARRAAPPEPRQQTSGPLPIPAAEPSPPATRPPRPREPRRTQSAEAAVPDAPTRRRPAVEPARPPQRPRRPAAQAAQPAATTQQPAPAAQSPKPPVPAVIRKPIPPRAALDPMTMTDQMEAIDDATAYRHKIDNTLARFSAAHDEMNAEETKRRERRERLAARPAALLEQTRTALQRVVQTSEPADAASAEPEKASQTRLQEKKERHNHRSIMIARITAAVVATLVFLGTGGVWGYQTFLDSQFIQVAALDENSSDINNAAAQGGDENFLMVGSDSRADASDEEGIGSAGSVPGARSDTVMIAHIPADRHNVVMTSFPRDLEITRPDCQSWDPTTKQYTDKTSAGAKYAKLNTAFAAGGPQCVTKVIQKITGLKINHFVAIDFDGFKAMVDAVQGVTVHTDTPIDDSVLGDVVPQAGDVDLTGDQALNFVRARHVKGDPTSDYGRIKRQQEFIGALLKKVMSKDVMLSVSKISGFVTAFGKATSGDNIDVNELLTLAESMRGLDAGKINFLTVPTTGTANTRGNEVLVTSKADALFQALVNNGPLPDPNAPAASTDASTASTPSKTNTSSSSSKTSSNKKSSSSSNSSP